MSGSNSELKFEIAIEALKATKAQLDLLKPHIEALTAKVESLERCNNYSLMAATQFNEKLTELEKRIDKLERR